MFGMHEIGQDVGRPANYAGPAPLNFPHRPPAAASAPAELLLSTIFLVRHRLGDGGWLLASVFCLLSSVFCFKPPAIQLRIYIFYRFVRHTIGCQNPTGISNRCAVSPERDRGQPSPFCIFVSSRIRIANRLVFVTRP